MDFKQFAEQYRMAIHEVNAEQAKRTDVSYQKYRSITDEANNVHAAARDKANADHNAAVALADAVHATGLAEAQAQAAERAKDILVELLGSEDTPVNRLTAWMTVKGHMGSSPDECGDVLTFLKENPTASLADLYTFGNTTKRWCSTFIRVLLDALEVDAVPVEVAPGQIETLMFMYKIKSTDMYDGTRNGILASFKAFAKANGVDDPLIDTITTG